MARMGRYFITDQPLHVIQRGNNRQAIFFEAEHYALYRHWLAESAARHGCAIRRSRSTANNKRQLNLL